MSHTEQVKHLGCHLATWPLQCPGPIGELRQVVNTHIFKRRVFVTHAHARSSQIAGLTPTSLTKSSSRRSVGSFMGLTLRVCSSTICCSPIEGWTPRLDGSLVIEHEVIAEGLQEPSCWDRSRPAIMCSHQGQRLGGGAHDSGCAEQRPARLEAAGRPELRGIIRSSALIILRLR